MTQNTRKSISYQITAVNFFQPFSAIFGHFGHGLQDHLDGHDVKHAEIHFLPNNRGNPFSAIFGHFGHGLPGYLDDHDEKHAEIHFLPFLAKVVYFNLTSIFCHFLPFPAITCLATLLSITRNARKSMAANFGQFLQC